MMPCFLVQADRNCLEVKYSSATLKLGDVEDVVYYPLMSGSR